MRKQYFILNEGGGISNNISDDRMQLIKAFVLTLVHSGCKVFYIDLFCGAGGVSTGVIRAGGKVIFCINHDETAIASHEANHSDVPHAIEDIRTFDLTELLAIVYLIRQMIADPVICLWASTECTHLSKAKGGESRDADSRTLARDLYRYIAAINPDYIDIENVVEFLSWGPLRIACDGKGKTVEGYEYSILNIRKNGEYHWVPESKLNGKYYVDWYQHICKEYQYDYSYKVLNSADYGEMTSRSRYFGQFKKAHLPFTWPAATHSKTPTKGGLFGDLKQWNACKPALDLKDEGKSVFGRKKDLSPKTYERIYAGLVKYVGGGNDMFIVQRNGGKPGSRSVDVNGPARTLTGTSGNQDLAFMLKWNSTDSKGVHRGHGSLEEPSPVITTQNRLGIAFLSKYYSGHPEHKNIPIDGPAGTITTVDSQALVQCEFLAKYYGTGGQLGSVNEPAGTLTTKDRLAVINAVWLDKQFTGPLNHQSIDTPAGSILTHDKHCLMNAFIMNNYSGGGIVSSIEDPAGTFTTVPKSNLVSVEGWLMNHNYDIRAGGDINEPAPTILASRKHYYLVNPSFNNNGHDIDKPCFTLIAQMGKKPPYLVEAETGQGVIIIYDDDLEIMKKIKFFMAHHGIVDIKMRMLKIPELLRIQGFGDQYILKGNQTEQKKQIGNSVTPGIAEAKVSARIRILSRFFEERGAAE
jgi:DNA (cytosine-5)-methyltransferase 1